LDINADQSQQPRADDSSTHTDKSNDDLPADKDQKNDDDSKQPAKPRKEPEMKKQGAAPSTATAELPVQFSRRTKSSLHGVFLTAEIDSAKSDADETTDHTLEGARRQDEDGGRRRATTQTSITQDSKVNSAGPSPISITRGPQGLIITSRDQASLDQFMKLIDELSPADTHFHTFNLKHADSKDVSILLETIFQDAGAKKDNTNSRAIYFFDNPPPEEKERNRLSRREPLRFIADPATNSILVKGADDERLAEIQALIEFYDRATPPDSPLIRHTQMVVIKYAKAQAVCDVIKDVYRDLLSPNDKVLASLQQQQGQKPQPLFSYFDADSSSGGKAPTDGLKFKGLLSVGVDATSNTLIVSCPQFLMPGVLDMIHKLDDSTKPVEPVVRVISMKGSFDDPLIKEALKNVADPEAAKRSAASEQSKNDSKKDNKGGNHDGYPGPGGNNAPYGPYGNNTQNNGR
jgi:hypothetical protein